MYQQAEKNKYITTSHFDSTSMPPATTPINIVTDCQHTVASGRFLAIRQKKKGPKLDPV